MATQKVNGTITSGGTALQGVKVSIIWQLPNKSSVKAETTTDFSGNYEFADIPDGAVIRLEYPKKHANAAGLFSIVGDAAIPAKVSGATFTKNINYSSPTSQSFFYGVVTREVTKDGQAAFEPFPGVVFKVFDRSTPPLLVFQSKTGAGGDFEFKPKSGTKFDFRFEQRASFGATRLFLENPIIPADLAVDPFIPDIQYKLQRGKVAVQVSGDNGTPAIPLPGVNVTVFQRALDNLEITDSTDGAGRHTFPEVFPGLVDVILPQTFSASDGTNWELNNKGSNKFTLSVKAGETSTLLVTYNPDKHLLKKNVTYPDGTPAEGVLVEVYDASNTFVTDGFTDSHGDVLFDLENPGVYSLKVYRDDRPNLPPREFKNVSVNSVTTISSKQPFRPGMGPGGLPNGGRKDGGGSGNGGVSDTVKDIASYPILTEDIAGGGRVNSSNNGATSRLGSVVEGAIRDVIGWRPKTTDPRGFAAALGKSFTTTEIEGRTETKWTPGTSALQVEADLGAITGAQASIYTRAKLAIDQSVPLLEGLESLRNDTDEEDSDAARSIVDSALRALGTELGLVGGPRVRRVDELFKTLRGEPDTTKEYPENEYEDSSALGKLAEEFGLDRDNVNTIEEEQNLTNFIIIVDHVSSLKDTWDKNRTYFDRRGTEVFLGTQLVLVSRSLATVVESVDEVEFALDSVFIGPTERQNLSLEYDDQPLFLSELLSWVDEFASEEAPRLIRDAGKDGVESIKPTLKNLTGLVNGALICPIQGEPEQVGSCQKRDIVPPGYKTSRVQRAIRELADHLAKTEELCKQIVPD